MLEINSNNFISFQNSLNLSGPACGLDCASAETPVGNQHEPLEVGDIGEYNFPPEHRSELCETLCDNGLGVYRFPWSDFWKKLVKI